MWSEELLEQFVILASQELSGDWVLCGASVLPLLGINTRTTWDIDLYGMNDQSQSEIMKLMDLVGSLGVPAECINVSGGVHMFVCSTPFVLVSSRSTYVGMYIYTYIDM